VSKPERLTRKCIASTPSPSLGGLRFYEIFNDPARLPREISVKSSQEAVNAIADGKVDAAIIPSALVKKYGFLNTVMETQEVPDMAISASPTVPLDVKQSIQQALTNASQSAEGKLMLEKISLSSFVPTDNKEYAGYSTLLSNVYGY
jgi:ABC-type phosphate/phosphonate transport system substrate-binding protein